MANPKYHFNEETLTFSAHKKTKIQIFWRVMGYIASASFFGFCFMLLFFFLFDSPKEQKLKRENAELKLHFDVLNQDLDKTNLILKDIQERDDNIYRAIFETDPIPSAIRDAGFGGTNRYEQLLELESADVVISTKMKLDKIKKRLYVQSNSFDEVIELAKDKDQMLMSTPSIMPVANKDLKRTASGYGMRIHPIHKVPKFHHGLDFSAATGTEIHSTGNGKVIRASYSSSYGNVVVVDHGYNYKTLYAHMSALNVKKGQKVSRGQIIGFVGNTGQSRGAHLHYEVHYKGRTVDPSKYLFNDLTPEQYDEMLKLSAKYGQSLD